MAAILQERIALSPLLASESAALAERLRASTVEVRSEEAGGGSGVIWTADGLIITNDHVVRSQTPTVILSDGRSFPARVLATDPDRDLAALKIEAGGLPAASIGDSAQLRVGQLALAMGNPLGLKGALTVGIIHAVASQQERAGAWIRADVPLAPGNSGGPLADTQGRVIGINSMINGGLALAVPSNAVVRFLDQGRRPAFLGVRTQVVELQEPITNRWGRRQESGLLLLSLVTGGAAARSGLLPGDILLAASTQALEMPDDLVRVLRDAAAGEPISVTVLRGAETQEIMVILGEQPPEAR